MSARGIVESEVWRSEQLEAAERESDPPNPAVGEAWVRIDIQPAVDNAQTLGALRIQGQGGVLQVPIIDINDQPGLGPDVYVGPRFFFGEYANDGLTGLGPVGFIPVTDQGGSKGSPRVVTSAGVEYESHDALELSAIPDSEVYYEIDEASGTTFNNSNGDETHEGTLTNANWVEDSNARHGYYVNLNSSDYLEVANTDTGQLVDFGTDFTIGVDLEINNGLSNGATIWEYSDGNNSIHMGKDGSNSNLVACYNGSTTSTSGGIAEPASTYQANVVVQWDASTSDATIYLDETQGGVTGTQNYGLRDAPLTFGKDVSESNNGPMNDGIAAIAIWPSSIVNPSEFTL